MRTVRLLISLGLGIAAGTALGAPAAAAIYYTTTTTAFNFANFGGSSSSNSAGNTMSFSTSTGTGAAKQTLSVTLSGWNANKATGSSTYAFTKGALDQWPLGLGVTSGYDNVSGCGVGGCDSHEVDNLGSTKNSSSIDFIRLDFSQAVVLGGFGQAVYPSLTAGLTKDRNGNYIYQYDDDYSVGYLTSNAKTNVSTSLTGVSDLTTVFGIQDTRTKSCSSPDGSSPCMDTATLFTAAQAPNEVASKTWYIAASVLANYGGDGTPDGFKLASLTAYYNVSTQHQSAVPEPSTWMTMIAGFGVAGTALRRARRQKAIATAA